MTVSDSRRNQTARVSPATVLSSTRSGHVAPRLDTSADLHLATDGPASCGPELSQVAPPRFGMIALLKSAHFLQTLVVKLLNRMPYLVEHNVMKVHAIKKAMYFANVEGVEGDYLEFGMFEGTSFIAAFESWRAMRISGTLMPRRFIGFDSFHGFKYFSSKDAHPFFKEGEFNSSYHKTEKRIRRHFGRRAEWKIVPGYVEETIKGRDIVADGYPKVAVAFIDIDLGEPTKTALDYIRPALQEGSVLLLDDFFNYRASQEKGVAGAFAAFQKAHPEIVFRRLLDFGYGGQGFIVSKIGDGG